MHKESYGVVDRWWGEGTPPSPHCSPKGEYSMTAGPVNQPFGSLGIYIYITSMVVPIHSS